MSWTHANYSKYNARKCEIDGIKFDSVKEGKRYQELKLLEKSGEIKNLRLQVPFVLIEKNDKFRATKYYADFVYLENGNQIVEDTKGLKTEVYKIKKKLMYDKYGILIKEI